MGISNAQTIRYVKQNGAGDGSSWANASGSYQGMINASSNGDEVWVATGTYQPVSGQSFSMKEGVKIYGGFPAAGSPTMEQRNWAANVSILQGNGSRVITNDNNGLTDLTWLDGFTITGGNNATGGGGIYNNNASPMFRNLIIRQNTSSNKGGGIWNYNASPRFINSLIYENNAGYGGAVFNEQGSRPHFISSTITDNNAGGACGGINNAGTNTRSGIINTIIYNNTVNASVTETSNIRNELSGSAYFGNSLIQGSGGSENWNSDFGVDEDDNIDVNPGFVDAASNDYSLTFLSPAINAGISVEEWWSGPMDKDLAGNPRVSNATIDIGAYETSLPEITIRYVREGASGNGYSWESPSGDLQKMIDQSSVGNQVWVAAGTHQPKAGQAFSMKEGVKIYGGFPATGSPTMEQRNWAVNTTVLQGNGNRVIRNNDNGLTTAALLDGFTITGGNNDTGGGGIYNKNVYPVFNNLIIKENSSANKGGGIWNSNAHSFFINTLIIKNTAGYGAAVFNEQTSQARFVNCTITDNNASGNCGGVNSAETNTAISFTNSIIYGNTTNLSITETSNIRNELNSLSGFENSIVQGSGSSTNWNSDFGVDFGNNLDTNPLFTNTVIGDYTLSVLSPAINMGDTNSPPIEYFNMVQDLAGNPRVSNSIIDIGAYETNLPEINIRYVKEGATGNGYSWETASGDLQAMINESEPGNQIWVASGTYKPNRPADNLVSIEPNNRKNSFVLKADVKIYGGFYGTENTLEQRNWAVNPTILSGDIGTINETNDNAYRIVIAAGTEIGQNTVLDGFTITNAFSQGFRMIQVNNESIRYGGGISLEKASPYLTNLIIRDNNSYNSGGAGGGIYASYSSFTLKNSIISDNVSYNGGGICADFSSITLTNVTLTNNSVTGNTMQGKGGGIYFFGSQQQTHILNNVIIWGNKKGNGNIDNIYRSSPNQQVFYSHNVLEGSGGSNNWNTNFGNDLGNNIDANPDFVDLENGNYALSISSPAINTGNTDSFTDAITTKDIAGNPRIYDNGIIDIGAYEYQGNPLCGLTTVWNGNNWSNGIPAGFVYKAVIEGDYITVTDGIFECGCLEVNNSAQMTVSENNSILVKNAINVANSASLTFENGASLVQIDNDAVNTGIIHYKRETSPMKPVDYTYITTPVEDAVLGGLNDGNMYNFDRYYYWNPSVSGSYGNWIAANSGTVMTKSRGYISRVPSGWNFGDTFKMKFSGKPNNGIIQAEVKTGNITTDGEGYTALDDNWNLIGNPYPSVVDYQKFLTVNNSLLYDGALHIWTHQSGLSEDNPNPFYGNFGMNYSSDDYAICNLSGCTGAMTSWNKKMQSAQSYFILVDGNNTNDYLTFDNTMRESDNNQMFFRTVSDNEQEQKRYWLDLVKDETSSQILIGYNQNTSLDLDKGYDAVLKESNESLQLFSKSGNVKYSIQSRGTFDNEDVVRIGMNLPSTGQYQLALHSSDAFFEQGEQTIFIVDSLTNAHHNLSGTPYTFTGNQGLGENRFYLVYQDDSTLGIDENTPVSGTKIYNDKENIYVISSETISDISVFAITGQLIYQKKNINASVFETQMLTATGIILIKVTTNQGNIYTKKAVINYKN